MKNKVYVLASIYLLGAISLKAQLNVGATAKPIKMLDVQGALYVRDSIGIGNTVPTQVLDINGTARLRTIPSGNGTVMLTADNNGVIRQQALPTASAPVVQGNLSAAGISISSSTTAYVYTGSSIVIPANSKYVVNVNMLMATAGGSNSSAAQGFWVRSTFSSSSTTFTPLASTEYSGTGIYISGAIVPNSPYSLLTGSIFLVNTTGAAKTYYYWAGNIANNGYTGSLANFGSSAWSEDQLFGIPTN